MVRIAQIGLITTVVLGLVTLALPSAMADSISHDEVRGAVRSGNLVPLRTILDAVTARYPGEFIEAELEIEKGVPVYEIKLITPEGHVLKLHYDARSGTLLDEKRKEAR